MTYTPFEVLEAPFEVLEAPYEVLEAPYEAPKEHSTRVHRFTKKTEPDLFEGPTRWPTAQGHQKVWVGKYVLSSAQSDRARTEEASEH